jgi:hypothetical protein
MWIGDGISCGGHDVNGKAMAIQPAGRVEHAAFAEACAVLNQIVVIG